MDPNPDIQALVAALAKEIRGQVAAGKLTRGMYSTDASNYRVVPQVVVFPRDEHDLAAVGDIARQFETPLTARGAGTSCAGNAVGSGIVVDTSRHLTGVLGVDTGSGLARVQPGVVMDSLQRLLEPHGLRFGPDPSTHSRCTFGGMIGNNACGSRTIAYGRTADNVEALTLIDGHGRRLEATAGDLSPVAGLADLVQANLAVIRTEFGRFRRQLSGYGLDHLLPEKGFDLAKALVGGEGTLGIVTEATLRLAPLPEAPVLVVLGYPTLPDAGDEVPALLAAQPPVSAHQISSAPLSRPDADALAGEVGETQSVLHSRGSPAILAMEGLDGRLVEVYRRHGGVVPDLPEGGAWLMIEVADAGMAQAIISRAATGRHRLIEAGPEAQAMRRIREEGAGLAGRAESGHQGWPGFEDAAVPPANLGAYLREFNQLLDDFKLEGLPYGHLGDGCAHIRIDFPLERGSKVFRRFMEAAGALVVAHGGSLSGEHGDGRARSELLQLMYSPAAIKLMERFKGLFDPLGLMNPGVKAVPPLTPVDQPSATGGVALARPAPTTARPAPAGTGSAPLSVQAPEAAARPAAGAGGGLARLDADLRRPAARAIKARAGFAFKDAGGDLTRAVHRCVGVAKCHADNSAAGGFMCPSFLASRQEKDSPRGRARALQEIANGSLIGPGFDSPELAGALELCLGCKACSRDCPAAVDLARLKSEVLFRRYRHRLRPLAHYLLGWLPRWLRPAGRSPGLANLALHAPIVGKALARLGGLDTRRALPRLASDPFHRQIGAAGGPKLALASDTSQIKGGRPVLLWADSFSAAFDPAVDQAAAEVLAAAGHTVYVVPPDVCCGLTWITTGQLSGAKRRLKTLMNVLGPFAVNGLPIIGVEPSCVAVLRSDLADLLPGDPRAAAVAASARTLAEQLTLDQVAGHWRGPSLEGLDIVAQPHCHQHAVIGWETDLELLTGLGAQVKSLAGCCGMAGDFGLTKDHYELSVKIAQRSLLPALAEAPEAVFLADGFSCRLQAADLAGRRGLHLAQLLVARPGSES